MLDLSGKQGYKASTPRQRLGASDEQASWGKVRPADYKRVYGNLPVVTSENRSGLFANGSASHHVPLLRKKSEEMLDGIRTFDPRFLVFLRALTDELNEAFTPAVDDELFSTNGIHAPFDKLKCVSGYPQTPMSYTLVDNSEYRRSLGLSEGYTDRQRSIASEIWKLVWARCRVSAINVPKLSTSGCRHFSTDVQYKLAFAEYVLEPANCEKMLDLVIKGDLIALANDWEMVFMTYYQKRGQVDSVGKDRVVFPLDYALSSGKKGQTIIADKRVVIDGRLWEDFSAMRMRVIHAGPWAVNCVLQIVSTCTMQALFHDYPGTFHVNTDPEIKASVEGRHIMVTDVTEFDRSMSRDSMEVAFATMADYWDERVVSMARRLCFAAYYAKPLDTAENLTSQGIDRPRGVWVGHPMEDADQVFAGNRSGHAMTALIAKVNKVIDTAIIVDRIYPLPGRCGSFLKGELMMGVVNNGDDEIAWAKSESDMVKFRALRVDREAGHYKVDPELGAGFSGRLLVRNGPTSYTPSPNLHTPFLKLWANERSIGGFHRRFYPIGITTRIEDLMKTEQGRLAWEIHSRVYRDKLAPYYGDFVSILMKATSRLDLRIEFDSMSWADRAVLEDKDKIWYKVKPEDVSKEVLEAVYAKIPPNVSERFITSYYKGVLQ